MPRTVSSPGPKSHGICGQRGFQEVQLNTGADTQSGQIRSADANRAKQRTAIQSWSVECQLSTHNRSYPQRLLGVDLLGDSDQPTLIFVS